MQSSMIAKGKTVETSETGRKRAQSDCHHSSTRHQSGNKEGVRERVEKVCRGEARVCLANIALLLELNLYVYKMQSY